MKQREGGREEGRLVKERHRRKQKCRKGEVYKEKEKKNGR
jgi:hypothetical protein